MIEKIDSDEIKTTSGFLKELIGIKNNRLSKSSQLKTLLIELVFLYLIVFSQRTWTFSISSSLYLFFEIGKFDKWLESDVINLAL